MAGVVMRVSRRAGKLLGSLVLVASSLYGLYNSGVFGHAGVFVSRSARWVSSSWESWRLRTLAGEVGRSQQALADLRMQCQTIDDAIGALDTEQEEATRLLSDGEALLRAVLEVRDGRATTWPGPSSGDQVEQDLAEALRRVEASRQQFQAGATTLVRLSEARTLLGQRIARAEEVLAGQTAELHRQQAQVAGEHAFSRGLDAARRIEETRRLSLGR